MLILKFMSYIKFNEISRIYISTRENPWLRSDMNMYSTDTQELKRSLYLLRTNTFVLQNAIQTEPNAFSSSRKKRQNLSFESFPIIHKAFSPRESVST